MSRRTLSGNSFSNTVFVNSLSGGSALAITTANNSTSSTIDLKISKQDTQSTFEDTDMIVIEDASGNIKKVLGSVVKDSADGFFTKISSNIYPDATSENLLLGTLSNSNSRKLLVVGDSEIQGDLYLQLDKKIISSNNSNDFLKFGNGTFTNNYTSNIFTNGISFGTSADLNLATGRSISRANDSNDKITFNSGNFTIGTNLIVNNGIIVKSSSSSNSGYVSFFEASDNGTNNIDLHAPLITTHDYNVFLPKIIDTSITSVNILSNRNVLGGTNLNISNATTDTITVNLDSTISGLTSISSTNATLDGLTVNTNPIQVKGTSSSRGLLNLYDNGTTNHISLQTATSLGGSSFDLILPSIDDTLVSQTSQDTLRNKTLRLPKILHTDTTYNYTYNFAVSELTGDRTITLPLLTGNDTFVFNDHVQTLTNKTLGNNITISSTPTVNATIRLNGGSGIAGQIDFYSINGLNSISLKSQDTLSGDFTLTLPAIDDTLVSLNSNDTLTNKTIGSNCSATLTALEVNTNPIQLKGTSSSRGYVNFYDSGLTKHISLLSETNIGGASNSYNLILPSIADTLITRTTTDTLTNKTLSSTTNTITQFTGNSSSTITTPSTTGTLALFSDIATQIGSSTSVATTGDLSNTTRVFGNSSCVANINGTSLSVPTSINTTPSGLSEGVLIKYDSGLGGGNGSMVFGDNGSSASVNWDTGIYAKQFINMKCGTEVLLKLDRTPAGVKTITIDGSLIGFGGTLLSSSDSISVKQDSKIVNTTNTECFLKFGNTLLENTFHRSQFVKLTIEKNSSYSSGTEPGYIELIENGTTSNTTRLYFNFAGTAFIFYDGNNLINTPSFSPSDLRVKKNKSLADTNLLANSFDNINIYKYQYEEQYAIDKGADPDKFVYGYIAQEIKDNTEINSQFTSTGSGESIYPNDKINYEGEKLKVNDLITVNKTDLNILLWAKCKEQQKQIDSLTNLVNTMKTTIDKLNSSTSFKDFKSK